tara:strand:- start:921 stop:1856 length:936 start_codon:yes stop_codon:yes gene_type:complete
VNVFVLPSYRAAARVQEPVQPIAQTAEQVVDALHAVEAGVPTDLAFGAQPIPYREWGKYQRQYIERLFGSPYSIQDSALLMFDDIDENSVGGTHVGQTSGAELFDMEVLGAYRVDIADDDYFTPAQTQVYQDANLDLYAIVASIETDLDKINFAGIAWQFTNSLGERVSEIVIGCEMQQVDYDDFRPIPEAEQAGIPAYPPVDCEQAFRLADIAFATAQQIAKNNMKNCILDATAQFAVTMTGCATASIFPGVGYVATVLCSLGALGIQAYQYAGCMGDYSTALANARAVRAGSRAAARAVFGDDCPGDPV